MKQRLDVSHACKGMTSAGDMLAHQVEPEGQEAELEGQEVVEWAAAAAAAVGPEELEQLHNMFGKGRSKKSSTQMWCARWRQGDCSEWHLPRFSIQQSPHSCQAIRGENSGNSRKRTTSVPRNIGQPRGIFSERDACMRAPCRTRVMGAGLGNCIEIIWGQVSAARAVCQALSVSLSIWPCLSAASYVYSSLLQLYIMHYGI
jgi:hypothetical protein